MFRLSPICQEDLELVLKWRNSERIRMNMLNDQVISWQCHCEWFKSLQHRSDREFFLFSIDNKKVGIMSFSDINQNNKNCSWGFYVGEEKAPKGTGLLMAYYALNYIFDKYSLHKINSEVISFNQISVVYHKKLKFEMTGILKEELFRNGHFYDLCMFSLFRSVWNMNKNEIYVRAMQKIKGEL